MNTIDAACKVCGKPITWYGVTKRICEDCKLDKIVEEVRNENK